MSIVKKEEWDTPYPINRHGSYADVTTYRVAFVNRRGAKEALTRLLGVTLGVKRLEICHHLISTSVELSKDRTLGVFHELGENVFLRSLVLLLASNYQNVGSCLVRLSLVNVKGSIALNVTKRCGVRKTGIEFSHKIYR